MIDFNAFSTEIFQILRSYEKEIVLYDENGTRVFEPGDARRMYVIGDNLLVSIVEDGDNSALKFYLSPSFNLSQVEGLLDTLRTISVQSNLLFHVKKYNKEIKPKDFAMQATIEEHQENHMNIMEGLYGTSKSSYLKLENARMIVRHSARVNERVIGARGRHIQAIFVENQEGERLRFPVNMLSGARAMTQHVSNGGSFADEVGSQIIRMARDFSDLAQVTGHINVMPGIAEATKKKEPKLEAYGVKGMTSKSWRKIFKNAEAMNKWCEENDAEVHAVSEVDQPVSEAVTQVLTLRKSIFESMHGFKRSFDRLYVQETYMKEAAKLVTGEQLSEDADAINERVARVTEMLGEGVNADAIATVARLVTMEALTQPLSEDDSMAIEEADSTIKMYKGEVPNEAIHLLALDSKTLSELVFDKFVEEQTIITIEGVDVKGQVVFFFPAFDGTDEFNPQIQEQLAQAFTDWCFEADAEEGMDHEGDGSMLSMGEETVRMAIPGQSMGECANHPAIKAFDAWMESFDPDNMFGGKVAEDEDMGSDEGDAPVEETFQGKLEDGDTVTITARGDHFGKSAVIAQIPSDPEGVYVVMLAGKPYQIARRNFDAPQLMSVNVAEPEMAMEDMAPPMAANDKWVVFGTLGINGKFKKKFDDEAARDEWVADHENDERFVITGTEDPVMDEAALRIGSKAYNEVSRLASSNIDRTADEKKRAKDIKWKADQAAAEAASRKKGEEVDEDLRPSMFTKPYDGPKQDYTAQIADIEKMNSNVPKGSRDEFNSVLNSCLNIVDPKNEKSIAACVDMLSPERVERLVSELKAIYDATPVHEAFDPEPTAGDTVTVTTAGKYKGKTATVVTVPNNPKDQWVLNVDGEDKKTMRSSFEFKSDVKEGAFRFGFEKFMEGAFKNMIDDVQVPGWYAVRDGGRIEQGPVDHKHDLDAEYHNKDGGEFRIIHISDDDIDHDLEESLNEGKSFKRNKDEDADDKKKGDKEKRDAKKQPVAEAAMGMSDEVAAKKIASKIKGTPDLTMPKIKAMVTRYLTMVDKAESDVPHLAALVHTELGDMVAESARKAKSPAYEKAYNELKALKRELKDATGGPAKERKAIETKIEAKEAKLKELEAEPVTEAKNHLGEKEQTTFAGWKKACKAVDSSVWFDGDKETCNAMVGPNPYKRGETKGIGEWDGETGSVYKKNVEESFDNPTPAEMYTSRLAQFDKQISFTKQNMEFSDDPAKKAAFAKKLKQLTAEKAKHEANKPVSEGKTFKRGQDEDAEDKKNVEESVVAEAAGETQVEKQLRLAKNKLSNLRDQSSHTRPDIRREINIVKAKIERLTEIVARDKAEAEAKGKVSEGKTFKRGKDEDAEDKKKSDQERKEGSKQKREQVSEGKESLEDKVARLQKEYADCDDFPTARHEIKAELDKAKKELKDSKKVKESVTLTAGTFFKLLGESELLFCKSINETKALVSTAEGQEKWFEASSLNIDPKTVRAIKK